MSFFEKFGREAETNEVPANETNEAEKTSPTEQKSQEGLDRFDKFFQDESTGKQASSEQAQAPAGDANADAMAYFNSLRFSDGLNMDGIRGALESGDTKAFAEAFDGLGRQVYQRALLDAHKLMQQQMQQQQQRILSESRAQSTADSVMRQLHEEMPTTQRPAVGRIAQHIINKSLNMGLSQREAIDTAKDYLRELASTSAKDLGLEVRPVKVQTNQQPKRAPQSEAPNGRKADGSIDWTAFLNG